MFNENTINNIIGLNSRVLDISIVLEEIFLSLERSPEIQVRILKLSNGKYLADTDWKIWGPAQGSPYNHCTWADSPEDTLNQLITGYNNEYRPDHPSDVLFWVKTNPSNNKESFLYVDGNSTYLSYEEATKRREEYRATTG